MGRQVGQSPQGRQEVAHPVQVRRTARHFPANVQEAVQGSPWANSCRDCKLYGGQQMDRLLAEFRTIADHLYLRVRRQATLDLVSRIEKLRQDPLNDHRTTSSPWKTWPLPAECGGFTTARSTSLGPCVLLAAYKFTHHRPVADSAALPPLGCIAGRKEDEGHHGATHQCRLAEAP